MIISLPIYVYYQTYVKYIECANHWYQDKLIIIIIVVIVFIHIIFLLNDLPHFLFKYFKHENAKFNIINTWKKCKIKKPIHNMHTICPSPSSKLWSFPVNCKNNSVWWGLCATTATFKTLATWAKVNIFFLLEEFKYT